MADSLMQIGAGGLLALLIIREVLGFLKVRRADQPVAAVAAAAPSNGTSGDKSPDFWRAEFRKAVEDVLASRAIPILEEIRDGQKDDHETIRDRIHGVGNLLQTVLTNIQIAIEGIKNKLS